MITITGGPHANSVKVFNDAGEDITAELGIMQINILVETKGFIAAHLVVQVAKLDLQVENIEKEDL